MLDKETGTNGKQLFIDRRFIDQSDNVQLMVNPPVKRPGAVLKSDKPWDAFRFIYNAYPLDSERHHI